MYVFAVLNNSFLINYRLKTVRQVFKLKNLDLELADPGLAGGVPCGLSYGGASTPAVLALSRHKRITEGTSITNIIIIIVVVVVMVVVVVVAIVAVVVVFFWLLGLPRSYFSVFIGSARLTHGIQTGNAQPNIWLPSFHDGVY